MRKTLARTIVGILFIAVGIIFLGNALDLWELNIFFSGWWTLFIIVPAIASIVSTGYSTGKMIWLMVGVLLLLGQQNIINGKMMWGIAVAVVVIFIGLSIIFGGMLRERGIKKQIHAFETTTRGAESAIFSSRKINMNNQVFEGIQVSAIFGGIELDLRKAIVEHDAIIEASAVFGGITLFLPQTVKLIVVADSIFGGIDNNNDNIGQDDAPTIILRGSCVFGGIEIK